MEKHLLAYYIGITVIFGSHAYMLYNPNQSAKLITMEQHCYINILATFLIAYYFLFFTKQIEF
jgi:hypothetical protein